MLEWVSVLNGVWLEGSELFLRSLRVSECDLTWTSHTRTYIFVRSPSKSSVKPTVLESLSVPLGSPVSEGTVGTLRFVSLGFRLDSRTLLVPRLDQWRWKKLFSPLKGWSVCHGTVWCIWSVWHRIGRGLRRSPSLHPDWKVRPQSVNVECSGSSSLEGKRTDLPASRLQQEYRNEGTNALRILSFLLRWVDFQRGVNIRGFDVTVLVNTHVRTHLKSLNVTCHRPLLRCVYSINTITWWYT